VHHRTPLPLPYPHELPGVVAAHRDALAAIENPHPKAFFTTHRRQVGMVSPAAPCVPRDAPNTLRVLVPTASSAGPPAMAAPPRGGGACSARPKQVALRCGPGLVATFGPMAQDFLQIPFLIFQVISNVFQIFKIHIKFNFRSNIHETSFIILLNSRSIHEKYKT
jgi:hypothetical protein